MMRLAPLLTRKEAHDPALEACQMASEQGKSLFDVLKGESIVSSFDEHELTSPSTYLGSGQVLVDCVLAQIR